MRSSKTWLLAAAMAGLGGFALHADPAQARVHVDVYANLPPPPLREEVIPAPRVGYVWVPGDWRWRHGRYYWHRGYWSHERHGYRYMPSRWERHGDRWRYHEGRWDH